MSETCPIWGTPATIEQSGGVDGYSVDSPRASGKYFITRTAATSVGKLGEKEKLKLTTWVVDQHRLGNSCPRVEMPELDLIKQSRLLSVHARLDRLLFWFDRNLNTLGWYLSLFSPRPSENEKRRIEEAFAWTECAGQSELHPGAELQYLLDSCVRDGLLETSKKSVYEFRLTPKAYAHLDALRGINPNAEQAFVAMWFNDEMDEAYNHGIDPAIRDAGYRPLPINKKEHVNRIDDEIIAEIRRSRFIVADFTSEPDKPRGGVYFEAGFAYGLGIPVIWTCREDRIDYLHFDTRQFNHIAWKDPADLREQLVNRIGAVIGDGPLREHAVQDRVASV